MDVEETLPGKGIDRTEKFVLMMLAYCHNEEKGCAWCTQGWLARKTCMAKRSIVYTIAKLQERGLIAVEQRATTSNLYTFPYLDTLVEEAQPRQVVLPMAEEVSEQLELAKSESEANADSVGAKAAPSAKAAPTQVQRLHRVGATAAPNKYLSLNLQKRRPRIDEATRRGLNNQATVDAFKR